MHFKSLLLFCTLLFSLLFIVCNEEESTSPDNNNNTGTTGTITGTVTALNGSKLSGVKVTAGGLSSLSDNNGNYSISNAPVSDRTLVTFTLQSYVTTQKITKVFAGEIMQVNASLSLTGVETQFDAGSDAALNHNNATVEIKANSLVDANGNPATGMVDAAVTFIDVDNTAFLSTFPGEFSGIRTDNSQADFVSYGYIDVQLTQSGNPLQLASGKTAGVTIPISNTLQSDAPNDIEVWYYDMNAGKWMEYALANKSGNDYTVNVPHFTTINFDKIKVGGTSIAGRVVDNKGNPLKNAKVTITLLSGFQATKTDYTQTDGTFEIIRLLPNTQVQIDVSYNGIRQGRTASSPSSGLSNIGDIVIPLVSYVSGSIRDNGGRVPFADVSIFTADGQTEIDYQEIYGGSGNFNLKADHNSPVLFVVASWGTRLIENPIIMPAIGQTLDLGVVTVDIGGVTVNGRVVDGNGNPVAGASVDFTPSDGRREDPANSAGDGTFSGWLRPNLEYTISITKDNQTGSSIITTGANGTILNAGDIVIN